MVEQDDNSFDGVFNNLPEPKPVPGVSDSPNDVCEWYKVNGNAYKSYTHAEIYDSRVLDWCKCPYYGKGIKITD